MFLRNQQSVEGSGTKPSQFFLGLLARVILRVA
jgi:hypothetical protein